MIMFHSKVGLISPLILVKLTYDHVVPIELNFLHYVITINAMPDPEMPGWQLHKFFCKITLSFCFLKYTYLAVI